MKNIIVLLLTLISITNTLQASIQQQRNLLCVSLSDKYNIKVKNDSGNDITVYNTGTSSIIKLPKNTTTTIKMEVGNKLYRFQNGKKGILLLTATADMDDKIQLFSKL